MSPSTPDARHDDIVAQTRHWLTRAVIGLNLCPFAKSVHVKGQIRYAVTGATDTGDLIGVLETELRRLADADPAELDTTLLIVADGLARFSEYNDFLYFADRLLRDLRLEGVLQIASFHPGYQFADSEPDDVENNTNRAPFPILHLLREDSIARAVAAFPEAEAIYERNAETMRRLGKDGWKAWMQGDDEAESGTKK